MESDEDDPIPGPSWAIPEVRTRTKKRVFSEDQKERRRALDRNRRALKRKAEMLANPEEFKAKHKANMKRTRSRQILANPEKFKAKHKANMKRTRSRQMSSVGAKDGLNKIRKIYSFAHC